MAIWLAAWLAGQLGWKPTRPTAECRRRFRWRAAGANSSGPGGDIAVTIATRPIPDGCRPAAAAHGGDDHDRGRPRTRGAETFRLRRPAPDSPAVLVEAEATRLVPLAAHGRRPRARPRAPHRRRARIRLASIRRSRRRCPSPSGCWKHAESSSGPLRASCRANLPASSPVA